jgi:hypothetical protein
MSKIIEAPVVSIDNENITIHNYVNLKGKIVLDKTKAMLLYIELHKFIKK